MTEAPPQVMDELMDEIAAGGATREMKIALTEGRFMAIGRRRSTADGRQSMILRLIVFDEVARKRLREKFF